METCIEAAITSETKLIKLLTTRETNERPGGGQDSRGREEEDLIETDMLMGHLMGGGKNRRERRTLVRRHR